jgi:hypothetical protein
MNAPLGGPGLSCSISRVRRLETGELSGQSRTRTLAHVERCARCQGARRELQAERVVLEAALPFDAFVAGVAERLSRAAPARTRPLRRAMLRVAASVLLVAALGVVSVRMPRPGGSGEFSVERRKGEEPLTVYVRDGVDGRVLTPGQAVPPRAALRMALGHTAREWAALALVDGDGPAVLYAGRALPGPLADAFEWTGSGDGRRVLVLDDAPVDGAALARRLAAGGIDAAAPRPGAEVVVRPLLREHR